MALYESVFIIRQDASASDVDALTEKFSKIVTDNGGKVVKKESWGLRTLAYKINKSRKGHYVMLAIDAPAPAVKELERQQNLSEDVMRYLTIRVESISKEPSEMMKLASAA